MTEARLGTESGLQARLFFKKSEQFGVILFKLPEYCRYYRLPAKFGLRFNLVLGAIEIKRS